MTKVQCKYCPRQLSPQGMPAHVHFKHLREVIDEFRNNPTVQEFLRQDRIARGMLLAERCEA